ncbi:ABC transporter permease subunit [Actinomyces naeslundii]|uniref:ABC transporter permease subunit n=1 Tax=Actinomyces naeslundii TaxID=1655 RepID=UPI00094CA2C3|nr:ABC transporter permease subunit [Actinomyces naeslundii]OLO85268.1 ABC transporter permease [Actinomyces naeslundii]OMG14525.1 ABC transporter permease [Actinomyces naeslundii]
MLTRVAGRLRDRYDVVTGISRLLALACLVGLVGVLPWLSGKDPALTILRATSSDREPTPEVLESIRRSIGIDGGPLHVIGHWLAGLTRGDLGRSWVSGAAVGPEAVDAFGVSLSLMAAALGVGIVIAAALVLPALRDGLRGRPRTRGGAVSAVLISLPEYLLAPILMLVLAVYLRILPPLGWGSPEKVIMPALSLGLPTGGYLGGLVSDAVTATFSERWVATWSTAGIRGRALAGAVLRRALTPLARQMALVVVALTGGAVAVEKIFAIPGLGRELLDAATAQDIPALQAQILLLLALALTAGVIAGVAGRLLMGQAAGAGGLSAPPPVRHSGQAARIIAGVGAGLLAAMVAWGIGRDPYTVVADKLQDPSVALPLGSDSLGRDVLARVAHGAVSTVTSAVVVTVVCFAIALLVGLVPRAATGFIEVANAAPPVLAGLIVAGVSGPSATGAAIAVAGVGWAPLASHAAGLVAENRQRPDVLLAPVLGEGRVRIALTRIVPAVVGPLARHAALRLPGKALALAGLGFLGLGAQSPTPEWGLVLSDALPYIERAPWAVATPAAALVVLSVTAVAASRSARR